MLCNTPISKQVTWLAPTTTNFVNMYLPSGTISLYARVSDFYGATSEDFMDTVVVNSPFGRRLLAFSWDQALSMVGDAVDRQSTADVNMLAACIASEANKAATRGGLTGEKTAGIVGSLVTAMSESVSSTPMSSDYVCEVANSMSSVTANPKYIDNQTLVPITAMVTDLTSSSKVVQITAECAAQFFTSLNSAISAQNLLANSSMLRTSEAARVVNTVESSGLRVMLLVAKMLIEGMSSTVSSDSATTVVGRELATYMSKTTTYTSQTKAFGTQKYTLKMPDLAKALNLASTDQVDTVMDMSDNTPFVAGSQILSMAVGISIAKDGSKLVVANLAQPINFTVPLIKAAKQAPPGMAVQCKCI